MVGDDDLDVLGHGVSRQAALAEDASWRST
jgi:hypothetical protein